MPKTPASAGGPRRVETIEMSGVGGSAGAPPPRKPLEKSTSVPVQPKLRTPVGEQRAVFELGAPPTRNPFHRGNTIREAVGEFVGVTETPTDPSEEMKSWSNRKLQFFNRKFKLSRDFVDSCKTTQPPPARPQPVSLSPVAMYSQFYVQAPPTPGLSSFQVVDPIHDARARSTSIESRRPRRESAFKIVSENCTSLLTKGRLTPTAAASNRIRRNNATASFSVASDSPLPSSSLTPGPHTAPVPPSPIHPMPSVPMRGEPRTADKEAAQQGAGKRELHRLLEADENEPAVLAGEGDERAAQAPVGPVKEPDRPRGAPSAKRFTMRIGDDSRSSAAAPRSAEQSSDEGAWTGMYQVIAGCAAEPLATMPIAAEVEPDGDDAEASTSFYPASIHSLIQPELISLASRDLPPAGASPPFVVSRPTMLPMGGDETQGQSMATDELFFDITPPKRPSKGHPALAGGGFGVVAAEFSRAAARGPVPLGKVSPETRDLKPDRGPTTVKEKKGVRFMGLFSTAGDSEKTLLIARKDKHVPLVDMLKRQVEARWHEQKTYRTGGVGAFGECLGRKTKQLELLPENLKRRLKMTVSERPFFTWWVSLTQLLVCLASICIFGFGAFSPSFAKKEGEVPSLDQTLITVGVYEKGNIWLGPKFADLIRLGAKYSPCMRAEQKIMSRIELDRIAESYTGCCVHTDGFCYQAGDQCPRTLATLHLYRNPSAGGGLRRTQSAPDLARQAPLSTMRRSEIVCGLDPDFCSSPSFHSFSREDITKWPSCEREVADSAKGGFRPRHLTCKVQGRPCCIHLQGRCRITTQLYCEFVGGIFHDEASLCSQVNCLHGICGMIPFGDSPNQIYRLFTSLFLHAGVLHLAITVFFQMVFMRDLENYIGWKRMAFIYFISGIGGNLASAIFVPFNPEVGPSGALAGIVTTLFVDVFANRDMLEQPYVALAQNGGWLVALFVVGLLPWVDNWAILFGTVFGLLATFVFLPDVGLRRGKGFRRFIVVFGAIALTLLFALLFYVFVENVHIDCSWCGTFNCFNWYRFFAYDPDDGNHFCDNQGLTVNSWLPI